MKNVTALGSVVYHRNSSGLNKVELSLHQEVTYMREALRFVQNLSCSQNSESILSLCFSILVRDFSTLPNGSVQLLLFQLSSLYSLLKTENKNKGDVIQLNQKCENNFSQIQNCKICISWRRIQLLGDWGKHVYFQSHCHHLNTDSLLPRKKRIILIGNWHTCNFYAIHVKGSLLQSNYTQLHYRQRCPASQSQCSFHQVTLPSMLPCEGGHRQVLNTCLQHELANQHPYQKSNKILKSTTLEPDFSVLVCTRCPTYLTEVKAMIQQEQSRTWSERPHW